MTRITAALITKNCADSLPACLASIRPHVDQIVIVDTGSTDETFAIASEHADKVERFTECNRNPLTGQLEDRIWDFSAARNHSFSLVPDDHWVFWADADDQVTGAEHLRQAAEQAPPGPYAYLAPYEYSYADAALTQPTCIHWRERLIRNPREMVWVTPCHEVCVPRSGAINHGQLPQVVIKHRAQASKNPREPMRNLRILDAYLKRIGEGDVRAMYYCGVELARHGMFGRARQTLERYVQLGSWTDEKCLGELELARIALSEGHSRDALDWCMRAMTTKDWPDPYWLAVQCYWQMGLEGHQAQQDYNFSRALVWAERGRPLRDAETVLFYDPTQRFATERVVARILAHRGHIDAAAEACRRGLAGLPGDADLMEQLRALEKVRIGREIDLGLERLVHLGAVSEAVKAHVEQAIASNTCPANQNGGIVGVGTLPPEFGGGQIPRYQIPGVPLIIGGPVTSAEDWASLQALGVTHVCSLTNPPDIGVPDEVSLHAPVPDEGVPFSAEQLEKVVGFAQQCYATGGALYLHCWVGASRSPSHGFAILRALFGASPEQALQAIQSVYPYGQYGADPKHQNYLNGIEQWLATRGSPFARIGTGEAVDTEGLPPIPAGKLDIVIVTGPAFEDWTPRTIEETGIGGSETMAWEMARHLARLGHRVRHYGWCRPEQEGQYEGVWWYDSARYRDIECDALVVSRYADLVQCVGGVKAKARLLWVHDVHCGQALTPQHALRFDKILCLSNWHKEFFCQTYPFLDPERVTVTRNGIDLKLFTSEYELGPAEGDDIAKSCEGTPIRNPHRAVYSSSPDRGLQTALELWPLVRAEVPDAELHVYYGFDGLRRGRPADAALAGRLEAQAKATPGVVLHGRVSPRELAREFMRSGVWFYPTWFCCHPDTRVSVPGDHTNGTPTVRIADMVGKEPFPVYAFNEAENRFQIATCLRVWETKIAHELVALELDSGETLRVTPDHLVLTFDGDWVEAGTLKPGDSLRALHYRYNVAIRDGNGDWVNEHRLVAEWKEGRALTSGEHVNHLDPRRLDNRPEMLEVLSAAEHSSKTHKGKKLSRRHVEKKTALMRATLAALSPEEKTRRGKRAGKAAWDKINAMPATEREAFFAKRAATRSETHKKRMQDDPAFAAEYLRAARERGKRGADLRWGRNHKVVSVSRIPGPIPVYDMEVEGLHNFVADGVVVHNCETSCITAMQAQAAGLRIVTSPIAALNETVGGRGVLIEGAPGPANIAQSFELAAPSPEYKAATVAAVAQAMVAPALTPRMYTQYALPPLADDWSAMLATLCATQQMPRFYVDPQMAAVARETDEVAAA